VYAKILAVSLEQLIGVNILQTLLRHALHSFRYASFRAGCASIRKLYSQTANTLELFMRTTIHIGQHKTGTTSIQHYLREKSHDLAKRGLYVPDQIMGFGDPSHFILNIYALNSNRMSSKKEELLKKRNTQFFGIFSINPGELVGGQGVKLRTDIQKHYQRAVSLGCNDIIWSNEGLYLLNSQEEYGRLVDLFSTYSERLRCVCCFRDIESYRNSYTRQLKSQGISLSRDPDSYRYVEYDSWLFDYKRKERLLRRAFDEVILLEYSPEGMVNSFMDSIGYSVSNGDEFRLNVTALG
jgi:hypothetical protein